MNKTKSEGDVVYEDTFFRIEDGTYTVHHYRIFEIKYLGATDTKGSRLKIVDTRHNQAKTLSKDYSFNLVKCSCGLIYLNPRPKEVDIGKYYPKFNYDPHKNDNFSLFSDRI